MLFPLARTQARTVTLVDTCGARIQTEVEEVLGSLMPHRRAVSQRGRSQVLGRTHSLGTRTSIPRKAI
jgi:hypothetical protein